jgi:hypothetical protein
LDEEEDIMILLGRRVILFSASTGEIVWMGENEPMGTLLPRHEDMTMVSYHQTCLGERHTACSLAFISSSLEVILLAELDSTREMQGPTVVEASTTLVQNEILENNWQIQRVHQHPVVITSSDTVVADTLFREMGGEKKVRKCIISFYP